MPLSLLSEVNCYFQWRPDDPSLGHIWLIDTENVYEFISELDLGGGENPTLVSETLWKSLPR